MSEDLLYIVMGSSPFCLIGLIFMAIAIWVKNRFKNRTMISKINGELVAFRDVRVESTYAMASSEGLIGRAGARTRDYDYNVKNSRPVFRLYDQGRTIHIPAEFSTKELSRKDVGRMIALITFKTSQKGKTKVIIDSVEHQECLEKNPNFVFRWFFGVSLVFFLLGIVMAVKISSL